MSSHLLADYMAQRNKRHNGQMSPLELLDTRIPEIAIVDTSEWKQERIAQNLPSFLEQFTHRIRPSNQVPASESPGAPHTLVLTAAALRAAELARELKLKDAVVAKLFAKHIKLKDAINYVKKTRFAIVQQHHYGRACALILNRLEHVVIDCTFLDPKKRSIFDMKDTQQPLMQLLNRGDIKPRYTSAQVPVKIIFY
ncbi:MAG: hypothetical protein Q9170_001668 [Blastenia crenularia]